MADTSKVLVPPNSKESEMMVLGSMLTSVNSLNVAADSLDSSDFYYTEHQIIFDVLKTAYKNDKPADVHLVCEELKRLGKLKAIGGAAYVTALAQYAGTSAFIEEYAEVVKNKAILRRMIHTAHDIEKNAAADPSDVHALLDDAQQKLFVISQASHPQGGILIRDILSGVKASAKIPFLKELQQRQEDFKLKGPEDAGITGLPTHFLDLDKMINGLGSSNFIILAARPAMGKCVTGDTQILDPITGALRSIKDLVAQGSGHVATLDKNWSLQTATPSAFVADGIKPTFKLKTALGKEIEATAVHPLLTINGWKRLEELQVGERIATPRSLPYFGKKTWEEHQLIALAYSISDDSTTKNLYPFSNTKSQFTGRANTSDCACATVIGTLEEKTLPNEIFELTKENLSLFVLNLFSSNGRVCIVNDKEQPFPTITYTSTSKILVQQLHHLLLRFGILSKASLKDDLFELEIQEKDNLIRFCNEIGVFTQEDVLWKALKEESSIEKLHTTKSDVYWDEIVSIEPTGEKEVFDLTVDQTHNFVAGDIIVHNTAFAVNIAENLCFKSGLPVGMFSLEMTAEQLLHRLICSQSEVESDKLRTGNLSGAEFQRIVAAVNSMQKSTMVIDDQPGLKITDLRARARRMKETHGIQFLVIDYLQLISGSGTSKSSSENRQNEISEISRMLKNLARELNIPIVCLSQLSRKVEERPGHRPMMSDLRESGCLSGDALIQDANTGKFYTIKELAERKNQDPIFVHAVDKDLKIGKHRMLKAFYSGKKIIYELKTRTGRSIKASGNHPFLKLNGWIPLEELKAGDKIGLPRSLELEKPISPMNNEELTLLGHLLGDGCILPTQPYHYTSEDEENLEAVSKASSALFGIQPRLVKQKNWYHLYLTSPTRLTHKKYHPITDWYQKLGIERVRSYEKKIPDAVFQCNKEKIALFLHHLWATDGNISIKKMKGRKDAGSIYYSSSSQILCQQTQHLLLRLGIQSTLSTVPSNKGYRHMYHLHVSGATNQRSFLSTVGCAGKRGHLVPYLLKQAEQIKPNPNCDVIPKEAWTTVIRDAKNKQNLGWREVSKGMNMSYCGSTLFKAGISRQRMLSIHKVLPQKEILNLAESDVYWDEILSIKELGVEDVYDATVENVHNFVANDIIVHNSLEQDSDVVIFLLRREYYDPYDKPGLAEVIVAKNRHGGVGSVFLTFRKELAQFANYSASLDTNPSGAPKEDAFSAFTPH